MTITEVKENLCYYDKRNPDNVVDEEWGITKNEDCYCDNCFYGRDELAKEIINLRELLETETRKGL
jgi:hypothetical protein